MKQHTFYDSNGVLAKTGYPRVTSILDVRNKPEVVRWMLDKGIEEATRIKEEAQVKGTAVHDACEQYVKTGDEVLLPEKYAPYFSGFMNWFTKTAPSECTVEIPIRSDEYRYAGRTDLVCTIDGELWLIDIKTSKRFDPGMGLQLAAYRQAWFEMSGQEPRTAILQLTAETKRGYRWKEYDEDFRVFLAHKRIFDWLQSFKKPVLESTWDGKTLQVEKEQV